MDGIPLDFKVSFVFGALLIATFSWDQLNRPAYEQAQQLARLLDFLSPADMRSLGVFIRAWMFYTGLLLTIYLLICVALTLGIAVVPDHWLLGQPILSEAAEVPDVSNGQFVIDAGSGLKPIAPLTAALLIVGLLPNRQIPGFPRVEQFMRRSAHRLVGIPKAVFDGRDQIVRTPLTLDDLDDEALSQEERRRLSERLRAARAALGRNSNRMPRLERALLKIAAFRSWVLDQKVWPPEPVRIRFHLLEQAVRDECAGVDVELNDYRLTPVGLVRWFSRY